MSNILEYYDYVDYRARKVTSEWEDLRQSIWVHILEQADKFDSDRGDLRGWVSHQVTWAIRNYYRSLDTNKRKVSKECASLEHDLSTYETDYLLAITEVEKILSKVTDNQRINFFNEFLDSEVHKKRADPYLVREVKEVLNVNGVN